MPGKYKLYNRDGSGGFAVEAALAVCGVDFELITLESVPNTPLPESFRAINPWGQVPVLITPDGTTLTECAAILAHIAARHPEANLAPAPGTDANGTLLRWMVFMSVVLYECILQQGYSDRYTTDSNGHEGVAKAARQRFAAAAQVLEAELGEKPFLLGDTMSVADIYLAMLISWGSDGSSTPGLDKLTQRVAAHPVIAPIWQRNFGDRAEPPRVR